MAKYHDYHTTTPDNADVLNSTTYHFTYPPHYTGIEPQSECNTIESDFAFMLTAMILSIICSIVSLVVCGTLQEFRNIHGRSVMSMTLCLLVVYTHLCLEFLIKPHISHSFCYAIAVIIHISFLGFFYWTTALAFDIWRTMARIQQETYVEDEAYCKKYIYYSIFVCIATVLSAIPAFVLDLDGTDFILDRDRPKFGKTRCWLSGTNSFTYYYNTPVGFVVLVNSILFILAIKKTHEVDQLVAFLQTKKAEKRLNMYLRLFYLMAIIWFIAFLPWMTRQHWTCIAAEIFTSLYGVFVFWIFVLNKRITPKIREKFFGIPLPEPVTQPINESRPANHLFERRYTAEHGF